MNVQRVIVLCLVTGALGFSSRAVSTGDASLTGRVVNYNVYFLEQSRLRHHRYELHLNQTSHISDRLSTIAEGRFRFDAAIYPDDRAPFGHYSSAVRHDELAESEPRQLYIDYLGDLFNFRVGLQQIDWIESLSSTTTDILTPLDLRHGGYGNIKELLEPVFAISVNHSIGIGSLQWLYIPKPKHHRLPKGENGYGYYEKISASDSDGRVDTVEFSSTGKDSEAGLRFLKSFDGWDLTLLGFHGHQRAPAVRATQLTAAPTPSYSVKQTFPTANTFGGFVSTSTDSAVIRFIALYEPRRQPSFFVEEALTPLDTSVAMRQVHERWYRLGFGYDYVFSKHLKLYSEHYGTLAEKYYLGEDRAFEDELTDDVERRGSSFVRLTNESFDDWLFTIDGLVTGPERSHSISPSIGWTIAQEYRVNLGGRFIKALSNDSTYYMLRKTSQIYLSLESSFDGSSWGTKKQKRARVKEGGE